MKRFLLSPFFLFSICSGMLQPQVINSNQQIPLSYRFAQSYVNVIFNPTKDSVASLKEKVTQLEECKKNYLKGQDPLNLSNAISYYNKNNKENFTQSYATNTNIKLYRLEQYFIQQRKNNFYLIEANIKTCKEMRSKELNKQDLIFLTNTCKKFNQEVMLQKTFAYHQDMCFIKVKFQKGFEIEIAPKVFYDAAYVIEAIISCMEDEKSPIGFNYFETNALVDFLVILLSQLGLTPENNYGAYTSIVTNFLQQTQNQLHKLAQIYEE